MKILIVSHNYFPAIGGTEKKIKEISERLVKSGEEVTVFSSNAQTTEAYIHPEIPLLPPNSASINGVRVRRFPVYQGMRPLLNSVHRHFCKHELRFNDIVKVIWNGPIIFNMVPHILKEKADIIVAIPFPFLNMYYAYIAKKIRGIPMAIIPCLHTEDVWAFDRRIMYKVLSDTEMILANTDYERNYLITNGVKKERISILGDGINPQDFNRSNPQEFRRRYDIGNAPVVLFVGRKEEGKGIDTLVDSMSMVWRKIPQAKLIVAGIRTYYSKVIEKKVSSLDARERRNIILIDNFEDSEKPDLFASADVFAMPSKVESFGITYLEAWASGKPVIGCRIGAVASLINEGKDGLLVEYGNQQELGSAILKLLTYGDLKRKLGENGRKKACEEYTWDIITQRFREGLNLAIWRHNRKQELLRKSLAIPEIFSTAKIIIMDMKDTIKKIWDIITQRFREGLNLAIWRHNRRREILRKSLVIPEIFSTAKIIIKIIIMDLKDAIKKILRKVPVLFYIAYYIYRKVKKFTHPITNKWILYKMLILIKKDPVKLKTYNEALAEEEQKRHSPLTRAMPTFMTMNMDNQCNLRCIMCVRRRYPQEAINALRYDFKIYKRVADETFPYAKWVQLTTAGEPLMANNLREQLRIIKKYSVKVDLVTNATLLNNDDLIKEILQVLSCLHVSIDAATRRIYESIRIGAKFEQVIENIRRFNRLREKLYAMDKPRLHFQVVLMKRNIKELPKLIELAKGLAVDFVECSHAVIYNERMKNESLVYHKELANYYMKVATKKADELNVGLSIPPLFNAVDDVQGRRSKNNFRSEFKICPFLWKRAYIEWNGDVVPCCVPGHPVMGNVKEKPFRKIWNNELYQEMRRRLYTDNPFDCCKNCFIVAPHDDAAYLKI
ncbi:D-inositol-3-phosphate glycosyltransferase [subsurface metagenome]|nr:glycosyltransferase [Clostridia bacterium]